MTIIRIRSLVLAATLVAMPALAHADSGSGSGSAMLDAAPAPDASIVTPPPGHALPPLPDPGDDSGGFVLASYKWIMDGGWLALVPFLVGLIWIARHPKTWPLSKWSSFQSFVTTARGAAVLTLSMALGGMLLHAILATGGAPTFAALKTAVLMGASAAGLYSLLKALIWGGAK